MQAEGKRICSVHLSDHETGAVSALELVVLLTACICTPYVLVVCSPHLSPGMDDIS